MPGNNVLAPRVLELWPCMGDFTTPSLRLFILKTLLGCLGGSWSRRSEVSLELNPQHGFSAWKGCVAEGVSPSGRGQGLGNNRSQPRGLHL